MAKTWGPHWTFYSILPQIQTFRSVTWNSCHHSACPWPAGRCVAYPGTWKVLPWAVGVESVGREDSRELRRLDHPYVWQPSKSEKRQKFLPLTCKRLAILFKNWDQKWKRGWKIFSMPFLSWNTRCWWARIFHQYYTWARNSSRWSSPLPGAGCVEVRVICSRWSYG